MVFQIIILLLTSSNVVSFMIAPIDPIDADIGVCSTTSARQTGQCLVNAESTAAAPRCVLPVLPTGMEHSEKMMKIENCIGQTDCLVITVGTRVRM